MRTQHVALLNDLVAMQDSVAYALRRPILAEAEQLIVRQEREIAGLKAGLRLLLDQVDYTAGACMPGTLVGACLDVRVIRQVKALLK